MVHPVPGAYPSAAYRQAGGWSLGWHTGRDYAAPEEAPIRSATHGVVITANAYDKSYGYKVIVRWRDLDVWYCHMPAGAATVRPGDKVEAGQRIGAVGSTGNSTGPHLHLEVRVKGARFAADSFRDPAVAVDFTPRPLKFQSVNIADDNTTGKATRRLRRGRLLTDILRPAAAVTLFQEAPKNGLHRWLRANIARRPRGRRQRQRLIAGASGRYFWGSKRTACLASGKHTPDQRGKGGKVKPFTWALVRIDGYRVRLVVNFHGPFGIAYKKKLRYWRQAWAEVDRLRRHYGLERFQVVAGGDGNGPKAQRKAAKKYGYLDARPRARRTVNARYGTTNGWKGRLRLGGRPDLWFTHESVTVLEYRNPRTRWNRRRTHAVTDHNRQILITE